MPIQFRCAHCDQPMEVDDEAADQMASCPYCRRLSRAPAVSDPTIIAEAPVAARAASAAPPPASAPESPALAHASAPPPRQPRAADRLGWYALATLILAFVCFVAGGVVCARIVAAPGTPASMDEMQQILMDALEARPWLFWLLVFGTVLLPLVSGGLAVAALALRGEPRWPAILSLALVGGLVVLNCIGSLIGGPLAGP